MMCSKIAGKSAQSFLRSGPFCADRAQISQRFRRKVSPGQRPFAPKSDSLIQNFIHENRVRNWYEMATNVSMEKVSRTPDFGARADLCTLTWENSAPKSFWRCISPSDFGARSEHLASDLEKRCYTSSYVALQTRCVTSGASIVRGQKFAARIWLKHIKLRARA